MNNRNSSYSASLENKENMKIDDITFICIKTLLNLSLLAVTDAKQDYTSH